MKKIITKPHLAIFLVFFIGFFDVVSVVAQELTYSVTAVPKRNKSDGTITLNGTFDVATTYKITYFVKGNKQKDSTLAKPKSTTNLNIINVAAGIYFNIVVTAGNTTATLPGYVVVNDSSYLETVTTRNPTCGKDNGKLIIDDTLFIHGHDYTLSYLNEDKDTVVIGDYKVASGRIVVDYLKEGPYSAILVTGVDNSEHYRKNLFPVILTNDNSNCIAVQSIKFLGAAYENFTGVADDDPKNFTQSFAYLSYPLNKDDGISKDAKGCERLIPFRNVYFQLTYGNTDNYKMYSTEFFDKKYINRLDLLQHAYLNGSLDMNLFTWILPQNWLKHHGDRGHLYVDLMSSFLSTNVTDTGTANNKSSAGKTYSIQSNLVGFNTSLKLSNISDSKFSLEFNNSLFWIFPQTKSLDASLSPQNKDLATLDNSIYAYNTKADSSTLNGFLTTGKNVIPYYTLGVLMRYNTSPTLDNTSNIFLRFQYTRNILGSSSTNYSNSYWQFQIGYNLDIGKIFYPKSTTTGASSTSTDPTAASGAAKKTDTTGTTTAKTTGTATALSTAAPEAPQAPAAPKKIAGPGQAKLAEDLNLRSDPKKDSKLIKTLKKGETIAFDGYTDEGEKVSTKKTTTSKWYYTKDGSWFWSGGVE